MTYARFPALGTGCVLMLLDLMGSLPYFHLLPPPFKFYHLAACPT